jgi:hypothetical protein
MYVIQNGALTSVRYREEIIVAFVRPYAGAVGRAFMLTDDNARLNITRDTYTSELK